MTVGTSYLKFLIGKIDVMIPMLPSWLGRFNRIKCLGAHSQGPHTVSSSSLTFGKWPAFALKYTSPHVILGRIEVRSASQVYTRDSRISLGSRVNFLLKLCSAVSDSL